jgi:hypothetical protein
MSNEIRKDINKIKTALNETSLNRVKQWIHTKDHAGITAFRYKLTNVTPNTLKDKEVNELYSKTENIRRNRELKSALLKLGYGVTKVMGSYVEKQPDKTNIELQEESYVVVNLNDDPKFFDNLFKLSEYYNQDSFLFKEKDSDIAVFVGTNMSDMPGYRNIANIGKFYDRVNATYMSRVRGQGYAFSFNDENNPLEPHKAYTFDDRKQQRKMLNKKEITEILNIETFDTLSMNSKRLCEQYSLEVLKKIL